MTADIATAAAAPAASERTRLPIVVSVLATGTFLMLTTEFVVAGILTDVSTDLGITLAEAGHLITVFAIGMVVGAPVMTALTMRLSKRLTLVLATIAFAIGHLVVALGEDLAVLMVARFVTALATGAFWAVSAVVATRAAGPGAGARAMGIVTAGGALATVLGVPLGALVAQAAGWRGTFWALAAAALVVTALVVRFVPGNGAHDGSSLRGELAGLRAGRLWLALLACVTTSGGVLAAYSFISPILIERAGVEPGLVPLVLAGFGIGSFVGTILGGRLGDAHPGAVTIATPAVTAVLLVGMSLVVGAPWPMTVLVVLLGLFGLSANGVLIHLAVRHAGGAGSLGAAFAVAAFNAGTAIGTPIAGVAIDGSLGLQGPMLLGAGVVTLTLVPVIALAVLRRRSATGS